MQKVSTRMLYLSSEYNSYGDSRVLNYNISSQLVNYPPTSKLHLILNSFSCAKTWYSVNIYNNTLYLANTFDNTLIPVTIPPGNYFLYPPEVYSNIYSNKLLANALKDAMNEAIAQVNPNTPNVENASVTDVEYDVITFKFTITAQGYNPDTSPLRFVSFSVPGELNAEGALANALATVSRAGRYNDVDTLLGGRTNRSVAGKTTVDQLTRFFTPVAGSTNKVESVYPVNMHTNNALYLRVSSLPTNNIESTNLSPNFVLQDLVPSDIFASILYKNDDQIITFLDSNENFSITIGGSQLTNLRMALTDDKGRLIPLTAPTQAVDGSISYALSIKVDEYQNI